jgi:hypothetical protein
MPVDVTTELPLISQDSPRHRGATDPREHIDALRQHIRSTGGSAARLSTVRYLLGLIRGRDAMILRLAAQWEAAEHERDHCAADALAVRNYVRAVASERDEAQGRALLLARDNAALRGELVAARARIAELEQRAVPRRRWSR